jgi:hypothetical protein
MKRITISSLSPSAFERAAKEIREYADHLSDQCRTFVDQLAQIGLDSALTNARMSPLGNTVSFQIKNYDMADTAIAILIGTGADTQTENYPVANTLLMIEFGAGIVLNDEQNPFASEFGMGVGTFPDQKHAFDPGGWVYPDETGVWHHTYGTKATMPMYHADTDMLQSIEKVARAVFK